ncbi:MAG: ATP-binding protein [Oscillospiraceae bacterium]
MILCSMTATFGKLDGETLSFSPGLNLITAPNEWGKSTWCAFLLAMLYGIDTRQRARQGQLPDKERYKPWSGKPMEGSMEVLWQNRRITIQRQTKGRVPMGHFRAFETETGFPVPELTADRCGQVLLGVERSVYQRTGFLQGRDLTVSRDEALSHRLNRLVTTGDDSPSGPALASGLRELKNKCRYNQSGLLPQARRELEACRSQLQALQKLDVQAAGLEERLRALDRRKQALEVHLTALQRQADREKLAQVDQARDKERQAREELARAQAQCAGLPERAAAERNLAQWRSLQSALDALQLEQAMEQPAPQPPEAPAVLYGLDGEQAQSQMRRRLDALSPPAGPSAAGKTAWALWLGAALCGLLLLILLPGLWRLPGAALLAAGGAGLLRGFLLRRRKAAADAQAAREMQKLLDDYQVAAPEELEPLLQAYQARWAQYRRALEAFQRRTAALETRRKALQGKLAQLTGGGDTEAFLRTQTQALEAWDAWAAACRSAAQATGHRQAMEAVTAGLERDPLPDQLDLPEEESRRALEEVRQAWTQTRSQLDACRGRRAALGDRLRLEAQEEALADRVSRLELWYAALQAGLAALEQAQQDLQSRFAPKIAAEAREILSSLTQGRYDRLLLDRDLSLSAGAAGENTVRPGIWRSDGTVDQLYLALRLAVSRALLPGAPLVLDDALTRFDDRRLAAALELLRREDRQILLFTCQSREARLQQTVG